MQGKEGLNAKLYPITIGEEKAPLLVIDQFSDAPETLVKTASEQRFESGGKFYPGIRAEAPRIYQRQLLQGLGPLLIKHFSLRGNKLRLALCHYSLVTVPVEELSTWQRVPHIDGVDDGLAVVHYLFKDDFGGTAFYRHRQTGFEYVDESRQQTYFTTLEAESQAADFAGPGYINGDTPYFARLGVVEGIYNRMVIYRRNSLHSGAIDDAFQPDSNPLTGRLSINSFIEVV